MLETWCLNESQYEKIQQALIGYTVFTKCTVKINRKGRSSGGIVVLVRNYLSNIFSELPEKFQHGIGLMVNEKLCGKRFILLFVYVPPYGSNIYIAGENNGVVLLETYISKIRQIYKNIDLVISGDFNARTKSWPDYILDDDVAYIPLPEDYEVDTFCTRRNSQDQHGEVNAHGKSLLYLCCLHNVHILNGRTVGDRTGNLTCFTANGSSVVDYTLASSSLFPLISHFEVGDYDEYTHLPLLLRIEILNEYDENVEDRAVFENDFECECQGNRRVKYMWSTQSMDNLLLSNQIQLFDNYVGNNQIEEAVECINVMVRECCKEKCTSSRKERQTTPEWWDTEMDWLKYCKYKALRLHRSKGYESTLYQYRESRKQYKAKIEEKKCKWKEKLRYSVENCKSASEFWGFVRSRSNLKQRTNTISCEQWQVYFNDLLNAPSVLDSQFTGLVRDYMCDHDHNCKICKGELIAGDSLNTNVTTDEVETAISQLRNGKSPGLDGITNEILKKAGALFVPLLSKLFNTILKTGHFPRSWCNALIVPVYKKHGNINDPGNYRGIALLSCVSKVFTKIINTRLSNWAIDEQKLYEVQAGFTKGKSTVDQVFVLQSLVSKYISKKGGRFYSVFIDFTKAFDNVSHLHLFYSLIKNGLHGRVIRVLRDMYSKLQSSVQDNRGRISEEFTCSKGTRQGCMLSPLMFIFYMNELIEYCKEKDCNGIFIDEHHPNVPHIFYADDLVLLGDHIGRLQNVLDNLSAFSDKWGLSVNMDKTNVMVFRNGGIVKKNENVYYKGEMIKHTTYYKYLGIMMSTRLSWSPAQKTLSLQAAKSMHCVKKLNYERDFSI